MKIWSESAEHDPLSSSLFDEKVWRDADLRPGGALFAERNGEPAGLGVAVVRGSDAGKIGYLKLLGVTPRHQQRGIGTQLLQRLEAFVIGQGAAEIRVAESAPNYLTPGVDVRYQRAAAFFQQHGYGITGKAVNQRVALRGNRLLDRLLAQSPPEGCEVRRAAYKDENALKDFLAEHWPSWTSEAAEALSHRPPDLYLAFREGRLIGFSAFECNNRGTGWFGPMGVARPARGSGLGRLLLARCLGAMAEMGFREAIIPWVGPTGFYSECVAAKLDREFNRFRKLFVNSPEA